MKLFTRIAFAIALCMTVGSLAGHADTAPFGAASAFNLVALGTVNSNGQTLIAGNVTINVDTEGRIAAANDVSGSTTVGGNLTTDPYGADADGYAIVAGAGILSGSNFNIQAGGNVYAPTSGGNINFNENPKGSLVKTGADPIDFTSLRTTLDALTAQLGSLTANGTVGVGTDPVNPSFLLLKGSSATLNVFTVTAAEYNNDTLDIEVPPGSTVIVNVEGTSLTLNQGMYFDGNQVGPTNNDDGGILFNFADATSVNVNALEYSAVLAPFAVYTNNGQVGGTIMAASIDSSGEDHNLEFTGTLPPSPSQQSPPTNEAPEPTSILLLGTGLLLLAGMVLRQRRVAARMNAADKF